MGDPTVATEVAHDEEVPAPTERFGVAVRWSFAMNAVRLLSTIGTTLLLAGLLGPRQFGTVAVALIYITLLQLLMQQGLVPAVIQRPGLTRRHLDSAFWLTIGTSVVFTGVSVLLSGWWAGINGAPEARGVILALSSTVIIQGLVVVQEALLRRQMHFRDLAVRTTMASVAGAVVGIGWAVISPSIWALVAQQLTMSVVGAIVLWSVTTWRPRFRFWPTEARDLFGFASKSAVSSLGVFVNNRVDALLVGVFFGPTAVGLYRLASRLIESAIEFAVQPIQHVALPEFSRHQLEPGALADRYRSLVRTSAMIGAPIMAVIFACARPFMQVLGPEWSDAAPALQFLCIVGVVRVMTMLNAPAIQAAGRPGAQAAMTWLAAALSAGGFLMAGLVLQDRDTAAQVVGMAASRAGLYALILLPIGQMWLIRSIVGVSTRDFAGLVSPTLIASVAATLAGTGVGILLSDQGVVPVVVVLAVGAVTTIVNIPLLFLLNPEARTAAGRVSDWLRTRSTLAS